VQTVFPRFNLLNSLSASSSCHRRVWLCTLLLLGSLWGCAPNEPAGSNSLDITGAAYAKDFRLTDAQGQERTLADFRGKVVLLFFGFTQCPDICPTALASALEVLQILGDDGSKVQVLFVSLDPERDTPDVLKSFVSSFHPSFVGLRADTAHTRATAEHFKVFYRKAPLAGSYTIDHSAITYVFDKTGHVRLASRPGQLPQRLADDVRRLLAATV
jgi:protein SCO1/2